MPSSTVPLYAIALGSNRRGRHGAPAAEVRAAVRLLGEVRAVSPIIASAPLGPSIRRYANAVAIVASAESPPAMLARLKAIERDFGRRRGQRWGTRVLDLDIVLWSGGCWQSGTLGEGLTVPHVAFRERAFVLGPLAKIVPDWRDPVGGRTMRQLAGRLHKVDRMRLRP